MRWSRVRPRLRLPPVAEITLAAGERRQCRYQWDENPPASIAINNRIETYKLLISQFMTRKSGLFWDAEIKYRHINERSSES
jgi:hypothetical protein